MFAKLIKKAENCESIAIEYFRNGDLVMAKFYKNAAIGFKRKAMRLRIVNA